MLKRFLVLVAATTALAAVACGGHSQEEDAASSEEAALTAFGRRGFSGQASVTFYNGRATSVPTTVLLPAHCGHPEVTARALQTSIACADGTGGRLGVCPSNPGSTSERLSATARIVSDRAFELTYEAVDGVCTGVDGSAPLGTGCAGSSPAYPIAWEVRCDSGISGSTDVTFYNGAAESVHASVLLPDWCSRPEITTRAMVTSIACANPASQQTLGVCPSNPGSTSEVINARSRVTSDRTFEVFYEAIDGVCTNIPGSLPLGSACGASSNPYPIEWLANCH
jgi:hypothetical protein